MVNGSHAVWYIDSVVKHDHLTGACFICSIFTAFGCSKSPAVLNYNMLNKRWLYIGWLWRSTVPHHHWCSYLIKACLPVSAPFLHMENMATVNLGLQDNSFYLVLLKTILRAFCKTCHATILYPRTSGFIVFVFFMIYSVVL